MIDPLAQVITLLRPRSVSSKAISGADAWAVRYSAFGQPSFCVVLEGACTLALDGADRIVLQAGDFVFLPATPGFVLGGSTPAVPTIIDARKATASTAEVRHGRRGGRPDVRMLGGYFEFDAPDTEILTTLLPPLVHVRGLARLSLLVRLVREETRSALPGRELVLTRLIEIMLIETLRSASHDEAPPGLLRGLADPRLAASLREIHRHPARAWSIALLADKASLSRSAYFDRFTRTIGLAPMEYLVTWRMALAKDLLRVGKIGIEQVATRVGYGSASAFSTAFRRHVGESPGHYARNRAS
jgi:AraC-like DNA-binding protein